MDNKIVVSYLLKGVILVKPLIFKTTGLITFFVAFLLLSANSVARGNAVGELNSGFNANDCQTVATEVLVDVDQAVQNDFSYGISGTPWASTNYNRTIKIWKTSNPTQYCAEIQQKGKFSAIRNLLSPAGTGNIERDIVGDFITKQVVKFTSENFATDYPVTGFIGDFNFLCDVGTLTCGNELRWIDYYFTSYYNEISQWWGFVYTAKHIGSWSNIQYDYRGDIL